MQHISLAVIMGFALSLLSALLCVLWGILRWNKAGGPDEPIEEIEKWATDEDEESEKE